MGLRGVDPESSLKTRIRPGLPGSQQRLRFVARLAAHVTRATAAAAGTSLAVRSRPGSEANQIVVAFPWRRRTAAEGLAGEVAELFRGLVGGKRQFAKMLADAARRLEAMDPGPPPSVPDPAIPVIAVTGTNGKTTTVRALSHVIRTAGLDVAYSSTDGVYFNGRLVEKGDY
jgi:cyanophycin synthetase